MRARLLALLLAIGSVLGAGCGSMSSSAPPVRPPHQRRIFTIPSSGMEPTLNCAKPVPGCLGAADDRVVVQPGKSLRRGDIVVFKAPPAAAAKCGEGGIFVKRLIGLPGDTLHEDARASLDVNGTLLREPYIPRKYRRQDTAFAGQSWHVSKGDYFVLGDNRANSCDSRVWGGVPKRNIIGPVVKIVRTG